MALTQIPQGMLSPDLQNATPAFKNRIINGAMVIDQRNSGAAQTWNGNNNYTLDRFFTYNNGGGGVYTTQQVTDAPTGFTNSLKVTVTTADSSITTTDLYFLQHKIEGYNVADLNWGTANAQPVTLSFWVKSSLTGSFPVTIIDAAGGVNYRSYAILYTINSANTWEYKTITIPGESAGGTWSKINGVGMQVSWGLGGGSQYTIAPNTWTLNKEAYQASGNVNIISTVNATWQITGVQLEKGSVATAFDYRDYGRELALCQRYYYVLVSSGGSNKTIGSGFYANSTRVDCPVTFKTSMRTTPTAVQTSGTNFYGMYCNNAVDHFNSFNDLSDASTEGGDLYASSNVSGTSGAAGQVFAISGSTAAYLAFQAEL